MTSGIYTLSELQQAIAADPRSWRPLVLTNGCFDLLHAGHVRYLQAAKMFGKALIVGLNSDRSIQTIKPQPAGMPQRPIVPQAQRAEILAALKPIDGVVIFSQETACPLVEALQPEIYAKGGDYKIETLPEATIVHSYGGQVKLIQIEIPSSTSALIAQIRGGNL